MFLELIDVSELVLSYPAEYTPKEIVALTWVEHELSLDLLYVTLVRGA